MNIYKKVGNKIKYLKITMKTKRGFTLIELLVVIAVIGILAGIVLVSVRKAPDAAKDSRIQAAITQVRDIAQMMYIDNGSFAAVCSGTELGTTTELATLAADIATNQGTGGVVTCYSTADSYCVKATMKRTPTDTFCVDNTGVAKSYSTSTTECTSASGTGLTCEND
jgi:prepilin-type N-terminal cleavage/methylation domain-containing protein